MKHYFIALCITFIATKSSETEAACQYAVVLMGGNAVRWMDRLEVQVKALNSFPEFEKLFIDQYPLLDDKTIAQEKLGELQQCGSIQEYISEFNTVLVL